MNLNFLYTAVSWVLLRWHQLFTAIGLDPKGGLNWSLSIVFLVITARLLLFRFFVKQVHYQRRMQEMQPKIKKLQEKHKGDKATLQREMMALQQAEGFNPITGCLPMFLQIPVFISLFHVLKHLANATQPHYDPRKLTLYTFTHEQTLNGAHAKLFGAPLAASLHDKAAQILLLGGDVGATRIVTIFLVVVSAVATLITQRSVMANQTVPAEGQAAMIQKLMLVGIPISVVFSGFIFPLGVLLYWFTSNVWTMFQQFYIHRFHPHTPGGTSVATVTGPPAGELGKSLAPKVGAKPNPKGSRAGAATPSSPNGTNAAPGKAGDSVPGGASRPARPARQGGNRPANKRAPSKKRR